MKIEPVSSINYDGGKVSAVRGYSKKEIRKKLEEGTEDDPKTPLLYQRAVKLDAPIV